MITNSVLKGQDPPDTFDNTMLSTYWDCPRKLYWFLIGVDYSTIPAYFTFGKAWHAMLAHWYSLPLRELSPQEQFAHSVICKELGRQEWTKDSPIEKGGDNLDNMLRCFDDYILEYPDEDWEVLEMEIGFTWPLPGTPYFLAGSMDGRIRWGNYGILVLENKTSGMYLGDNVINQYTFSPQVNQYIWGLTMFQGEEIFGCLMNIVSKRPQKKVSAFVRTLEKRSLYQLKEYELHTRLVIEDIMRDWDRWIWPKTRNEINCAGGIGRAPCLMQNLCRSEEDFTEVNPMDFPGMTSRDGKWEPWKRSGE